MDLDNAILSLALDGDLKHPLEVAIGFWVKSIGQR
jgi:hypothetical protein